MKLYANFAVLACVAVLLTACAGSSTLRPAPQFSRQLGQHYTSLSMDLKGTSHYQWRNRAYFADKAQQAQQGVDVQPEDPATWALPPGHQAELNNAHRILQTALVPDRKKVLRPWDAADAQAYFDCWIEQQARAGKSALRLARRNDCRAAFYTAFCQMYNGRCTAAIDSSHIFRLYFDAGQSRIRPVDQPVVKKIATVFKKGGKEIIVAGHADGAGSAAANMRLSRLRAEAVRDALAASGVPIAKVTVRYFGAKLPFAAPAHQQPQGGNRRALVIIR